MEIREKWESCLHILRADTLEVKTTCRRAFMKDGVLYTDKETCASCPYWKGWGSVTQKEIDRIRRQDCSHCRY